MPLGDIRTGYVIEAVDRATHTLNKVEERLKRFNDRVSRNFQRSKKYVDASYFSLGRFARLGAVLYTFSRVSAYFHEMTNAAISFERALDSAVAKFGGREFIGSQAVQALEDTAKRVAATSEVTSSQAAIGLERMALAGLSYSEAIEGLPHAVRLSIIGNKSMTETVDILTASMHGYNLEASDLAAITDQISVSITNTPQDINNIANAFKYAAPQANAMNIALDETFALFGVLSRVLKDTQAGTAVRSILNNLVSPADSDLRTLQDLGIAIADAQGNILPIFDILKQFQYIRNNSAEDEWARLLSRIFEQRGAPSFAYIIENLDDVIALHEKMINSSGEAERIESEMTDNLLGDLRLLKSAAELVAISFTEIITPSLRVFIDGLTTSVRGLATNLPKIVSPWIKILTPICDFF